MPVAGGHHPARCGRSCRRLRPAASRTSGCRSPARGRPRHRARCPARLARARCHPPRRSRGPHPVRALLGVLLADAGPARVFGGDGVVAFFGHADGLPDHDGSGTSVWQQRHLLTLIAPEQHRPGDGRPRRRVAHAVERLASIACRRSKGETSWTSAASSRSVRPMSSSVRPWRSIVGAAAASRARAVARMGSVCWVAWGRMCDRVARVKSWKRRRSTTVRHTRWAARSRRAMRSTIPTRTASSSSANAAGVRARAGALGAPATPTWRASIRFGPAAELAPAARPTSARAPARPARRPGRRS